MEGCGPEVEQLFISLNLVNVISAIILMNLILLVREYKFKWVLYAAFIFFTIITTFSSYHEGYGCQSGPIAVYEWFPGGVGLDGKTYYLIYKFILEYFRSFLAI